MHIIIGGAYNGKLAYVEQLLNDEQVSFYHGKLPTDNAHGEVAVMTNFEAISQPFLQMDEMAAATLIFEEIMQSSVQFKQLYIVATDIGRGIVPIDATQRKQRDVLGRLYQMLFKESETITRVWYGIPQKLK